MSSFQAYAPLRTSIVEQLWPLGRVPVIRIRSPDALIADVASVHRHVAGLPAHLHRALALIVERHEHIVFLTAPQHAHVPGPVEQDCLQVLRTGVPG